MNANNPSTSSQVDAGFGLSAGGATDRVTAHAPKEKIDLLMKMFQEHYSNARHHETQRANSTHYVLLIGGLLGTVISNDGLEAGDWPLTAFVVLVGLFGAVFSASHFERYNRHKARAGSYREEIDRLIFEPGTTLTQIKRDSDLSREADHPILARIVSVHWLWMLFPLLVSAFGVILTAMALGF